MAERFWMVCFEYAVSSQQYQTLECAKLGAEGVARKCPGAVVYILEATEFCKVEVQPAVWRPTE